MLSFKVSPLRDLGVFLVCLLLGILIVFQYKSLETYKLVGDLDRKTERELIDELIKVQNDKTRLQKRRVELESKMRQNANASVGSRIVEENQIKELERVKTIACLTDVRGTGIMVRIFNNGDNYAGADHISIIVNELKASDAQAIAVNNERITATSEIVNKGINIKINGREVEAPFTVKAIGDPHKLEYSLNMLGGKIEYLVNICGLKAETEVYDDIFIPKAE